MMNLQFIFNIETLLNIQNTEQVQAKEQSAGKSNLTKDDSSRVLQFKRFMIYSSSKFVNSPFSTLFQHSTWSLKHTLLLLM